MKRLGALYLIVGVMCAVICLASVPPLWAQELSADAEAAAHAPGEQDLYAGKVLRSHGISEKQLGNEDYHLTVQDVDVRVTEGPYKGKTVRAQYQINQGLSKQYRTDPLEPSDQVLLYIEQREDGTLEAYVGEVKRDHILLYLSLAFAGLLILVGGLKGVKAVLSLAFTLIAIVKILLPAILKGHDPVWVSVLVCVIVITLTLIIICGWNRKTLAAIIGTAGGVIVAGLVALWVGNVAKLTGLGSDESQMLMYVKNDILLDFRGLLFAGIIIGTMGATMDIGVSIASAMHEIRENSNHITRLRLIQAGMNVGRDAMGTMANTLILAYTGGSLQLILLFIATEASWDAVINWDLIASEIVRSLAGSIGIVIAIPITVLSSAFIGEGKKADQENADEVV